MSDAAEIAAPRHLVVRLPNPLGDAVMAVPALRALRAALPDTRITWAGRRAPNAVLEGLPYRDDVMPLEGRTARGRAAAAQLRRLGADATLLLPGSLSSAVAARVARTPVRVGVPGDGRRWLLTHAVDVPRDPDAPGKPLPRPMTEHYLALAAPFGARPDDVGVELRTTAFDEERVDRRFRDVADGVVLLGVNPGAAFGETKILPPETIAAAVRAIREEFDVLPVVLCGPGERVLGEATAAAIGDCLSVHDDVPDIGELKALVRRLAVLVSADAGPRHVAEALGTKVVVWMGPTDPRWSGHSAASVVRNEALDCLACHLKRCPIGLPCMKALDPMQLASATRALLTEGRS